METKVTRQTWLAILATGMITFLGMMLQTGLTIALPSLMQIFRVDADMSQLINSLYDMMVTILIIMSPFLVKRFKTPVLFFSSIVLFLIGIAISALTTSFGILLFGRLVQGIAVGITIPLMFNIILTKVPRQKMGMMIGVGTLMITLGPAVGSFYGSLVLQLANWPFLFWIVGGLVLVSLLMGMRTITPLQATQKVQLDWLGLLEVILVFGGYTFGFSFLSSQTISPVLIWGSLGLALIFTMAFIYHCNHSDEPLLRLTMFKQADFRRLLVAFFISQIVAVAIEFILSMYLQSAAEFSAVATSLVIFPGALLAAVVSPFGGILLDRHGAKRVLYTGSALYTVGLILFVVTDNLMGAIMATLFYMAVMLGLGIVTGDLQTSGLGTLDGSDRTDGNALFNAAQQFAGTIGLTLIGTIFTAFQAGKKGLAFVAGTRQGSLWSFVFLTVLTLIADYGLWLTFRHSQQNTSK
ncbi:transport protein [Lactobacillus selangorensis]|uniref:Transport protein n=1 Tax=Lactobacillus selangorensis TaxID=81857 RepID=A0A0R2FHQ0_9LACO|nr:MFS transporter [Lactobacillus selangorensis]KRN28159.1 transport protein [Lactobacillus selangorensis]KRN30965.1 transport protein [Lactobacillus selangorensis]